MALFEYIPEFPPQKTVKPRVNNISFGDGYTQRIAVGINTQAATWALTFANRDLDEADGIEAFFVARAGVESFEWAPPGSVDYTPSFICQEWTRSQINATYYTITATFQQVFD